MANFSSISKPITHKRSHHGQQRYTAQCGSAFIVLHCRYKVTTAVYLSFLNLLNRENLAQVCAASCRYFNRKWYRFTVVQMCHHYKTPECLHPSTPPVLKASAFTQSIDQLSSISPAHCAVCVCVKSTGVCASDRNLNYIPPPRSTSV